MDTIVDVMDALGAGILEMTLIAAPFLVIILVLPFIIYAERRVNIHNGSISNKRRQEINLSGNGWSYSSGTYDVSHGETGVLSRIKGSMGGIVDTAKSKLPQGKDSRNDGTAREQARSWDMPSRGWGVHGQQFQPDQGSIGNFDNSHMASKRYADIVSLRRVDGHGRLFDV